MIDSKVPLADDWEKKNFVCYIFQYILTGDLYDQHKLLGPWTHRWASMTLPSLSRSLANYTYKEVMKKQVSRSCLGIYD